jgi:hypothetical protein
MTDHPLDNPLWSALGGSLAQYCIDFGGVRLLYPELGTVAAMMRVTSANLSVLASAIPIGAELLVIAPEPVQSTAELDIVHVKPLFQMVAGHLLPVINTVVTSELSAADLHKCWTWLISHVRGRLALVPWSWVDFAASLRA